MRVLITGITGFVGSHMAEYLLSMPKVEVYGFTRWRSDTVNIEAIKPRLNLVECDIKDDSSVDRAMDTIRPDKIFHFAAQSYVPSSWNAPSETLTTNILGQLHLLEAVRKFGLDPFIVVAGSSEEYGLVHPEETPIRETNVLRPLSPYAVSKVGQDLLGYQYFQSYKLKIVRTRAFNHTGPRRGEVFMTSNFAKQIAQLEKTGADPVIKVGNLDSRRDFTDVRDVVKAYWLASEKCEPGEVYNICSGKAWSAKEVLDILLGMSRVKLRVEKDPSRIRPSDVLLLLGDNAKLVKATGWRPQIPLEKTLEDLLNYWRGRS